MAGDRDLSSLLPDAPPPRPVRRTAAIETALRRFDGIPDAPVAAAAPIGPARPGWRQRFAGPQAGALAAILLVALVGLPVWMFDRDRIVPPAAVPERSEPSAIASARALEARERSVAAAVPKVAASPSAPASADVAAAAPSPAAPIVASAPAPMPAPAAAPPPAPAPEQEMVVTGQRRQESIQDVPMAVTAVTTESLDRASPSRKAAARAGFANAEDDASEVVVTGSRIDHKKARAAAAASQRGDWNACTIDDPRQSVEKCGKRVDPATPLGEGIVKAWKGDLAGAIAAFDRAIAAQPRKAAAWLNRGLAHAREGEYDKALADLDRVVRIEPGAARSFYHRSLIYRRLGDTRHADRDATRAVEMDSRYRDLIP